MYYTNNCVSEVKFGNTELVLILSILTPYFFVICIWYTIKYCRIMLKKNYTDDEKNCVYKIFNTIFRYIGFNGW